MRIDRSYRVLMVTTCLIGLGSGCHSEHREPPPRAVIVEPGYYYDAPYRDEYGHDHPRTVYYFDGHHYAPHEAPPPNVVIRERVHVGHEELHEGDRRPPGEELHGDFNHDDRGGQLGPRDR